MKEKKIRTKYFNLKEVRLSIAHIILWSLLTIGFFTYLTIEVGEKIERGPLYFFAVIVLYIVILVILTMYFTHRFFGPFERLKMQMRVIRSGDHQLRLTVRTHDDIYIRSFILEANKLIDSLETMHVVQKELLEKVREDLAHFRSLSEGGNISQEELKKALVSFSEKIEMLLKNEGN
jgi:nitrogen fixation/metabolism regulation signal transduction histidine kinase